MSKFPKNFKPVEYFVPGRKRRIAGSTQSTNNFLVIIHNVYPTFTISQLREVLTDRTQWILNPEAIEVLDAHIKVGFGDYVPDWK